MSNSELPEYFLQVVKKGEKPVWPRPEKELVIGQQELGSDYIQYWAYLKESGVGADQLPHAESVAMQNPVKEPIVLVDQPALEQAQGGEHIEIVLARNGHAWGKTESNLENLEDNVTSVVDFAKNQYNMIVKQFMTTPNTTANVKKKLQDLEEVEKDQEAEVAPVELAEEPVETTTPTAETASEPTEEKSVQPEDSAIVNDAAAAESTEKTSDSSTEEVSAEQVSVEPSAEEPATEPSVTALEEDQPPAAEESRTPQTDTETQKPATEIPLQAEPFVTTAVVEDHEPVAPAVSEPAPEPTVPEQGLSSEASTETPEPALADPAVVKAASTDMKDQIPTSGVYAADKPSHSKGGLLSKLWILVPIIVIVGLVAAALLFRDRIFSKLSSEEGTVVPVEASISPTPVTQIQPTSAPTPTVATIDRSKYKVRVLNGTEKAGLAGSLATELKAKGWTVSETGNAGDQSMEQTLVKYKKELDAVGKQLVDDLAAKYNAKSSATLTAADKADLEVTIGAK